MSYGIVLVFDGVGADQYWAVNNKLGINPRRKRRLAGRDAQPHRRADGNRVGCRRGLEQQG